MKRIDPLILALFLFPLFSIAQTNYKPGYVVTIKGDTLKGYINYMGRDENPNSIDFKSTPDNSTAENFTNKSASAFAVSGFEYFKRFTVNISQDQVELSNLKQGADTSYITYSVFLRILVTGNNVSLFSFTDKIKTRYYILEGNEAQPQELVYRVYYNLQNAALLQTENRYRVQVEYLAQKYHVNDSKLERQISNSQYSEAELMKIVQVINGNSSQQFTSKNRFGTRWYAGIGVTNNNLSFKYNIRYPNNSSTFPKISAGFDLFTNKNTEQFFFRAEMSYSTNQHSFIDVPDIPGNSGYSTSLNNVIQHNVSFSPQLVYSFYNSDKFKVFFDFGASINFSYYNNYQFSYIFNNGVTTVINESPTFDKNWVSFPIKSGIVWNKTLDIYISYTPSTIITGNNPATGVVYEYQAGINYLFGAK